MSSLNCLNNCLLEGFSEVLKLSIIIEFGSCEKSLGPSENGGDGVGRGFFSLLMESVMSSNSSVSSFGFNSAIWALEHRGHKTKGSVTLSNDIRLNISIVVLAGPHEPSVGFHGVSNHIIDKSMLVPHVVGLKILLVVRLINFLKDIFESTIVLLHDGVLGAHVKRVVPLFGILERSMGESNN